LPERGVVDGRIEEPGKAAAEIGVERNAEYRGGAGGGDRVPGKHDPRHVRAEPDENGDTAQPEDEGDGESDQDLQAEEG
jgi:hypothetical protein